jgi:hypothetical protein
MEIPAEWRTGEVWDKWEELRQTYGEKWDFAFEHVERQGDIQLAALLKTLDGRRHVQYEIVHPPDFHNLGKVCGKIESLRKKVLEANKLSL